MPENYSKRFNRGSGRFASSKVDDATRTPSPDTYSGLANNPQFERSYELQNNQPVDGSKSLLRAMSPFTLSVVPPLIFENTPSGDPLLAIQDAGASVLSSLLGSAGNLFTPQGTPLSRGDIVVQAALAEWERDVREPKGEQANGIDRIREYIQGDQGSGWTWRSYDYDGQEGADWCGHFATFVYGAAGLSQDVRKDKTQSTARLYRWARDNPQRLIGSVDENKQPVAPSPGELQPGDIVVIGTPGSGRNGAGKHITIVESVTSEGVYTIEGNARGTGADGERANGVIRTFRPFDAPEGKSRILYGVRPLPEDYDDPFYDNTGLGDAGLFAPLQSRIAGSGRTQSPGIVDVALAKNKAFGTGKQARQRATQELINSALGGRGSGSISPSEFVSQGLQRAAEEGFDEPAFSDKLVAVDTLAQLDAVLNTPPLTLLINPNSFQISYTQIQQFSQRTRTGYIFQRWGEEKPKITISGNIGAYVAGQNPETAQSPNGQTFAPSGAQFASRRDSAAFQNLMNLLTMFKHNGYIYDRIGKTNAHLFVGAIAIDYDNWTYIGNFDSFNWGEEEAKPNGGISFDMEFVVTQMYDNDPRRPIRPLRSLSGASVDPILSTTPVDSVGNSTIPSAEIPVEEPETLTSTGFDFTEDDFAEEEETAFLDSGLVFTEEDFDEDGNFVDATPFDFTDDGDLT